MLNASAGINGRFITTFLIKCYANVTANSAKSLVVHAIVMTRLDHCNRLLVGLPHSQINKLQLIQNAALAAHWEENTVQDSTIYMYVICAAWPSTELSTRPRPGKEGTKKPALKQHPTAQLCWA